MKLFPALFLFAFTLPALTAYDGPPKEKAKWVAFCVDGLKDTGEKERARGVYCRCMSDYVDAADHRRLYEWERIFPPAHLGCYKKAGFKPPPSR